MQQPARPSRATSEDASASSTSSAPAASATSAASAAVSAATLRSSEPRAERGDAIRLRAWLTSEVRAFNERSEADTRCQGLTLGVIADVAERGLDLFGSAARRVAAQVGAECRDRGVLVEDAAAGLAGIARWACEALAVVCGRIEAQNIALTHALGRD